LNSTSSSINTNSPASSITSVNTEQQVPKEDSDFITLQDRKYWKGRGSQTFILPCDDDENDRLMTMVTTPF
jgi:anti-sigma factor ChrR (cupin superfamily)